MKPKTMTPSTSYYSSANHSRRQARRGFTLIEMVIVVGIVLLVLALVLPASINLWNERKISDADNIIRGLLMTARANALRTDQSETGLFFYLDQQGVQRIATIERDPDNAGNPAWQDVFRVVSQRTFSLPPPIRVVPRYVVDPDDVTQPFLSFSAEELSNNSFVTPAVATFNQAQRQRNFFTMVYSSDGDLVNRRDVIIRDDDLTAGVAGSAERRGSVTGLQVGRGGSLAAADVDRYYRQDDSTAPLDPTRGGGAVDFAVIEPQPGTSAAGVAMNFPSVDGLLVYDDSQFNDAADDPVESRLFLLKKARPFYVNRYTGAIIPGPFER